jgi:hypothetical protein
MKIAAERDKNGGILKRILNACGKYSTLCPYCFDTETGESKEDTANHATEECTHKSATAARTNLEAKTLERQWREGPLGKLNENVYSHVDGETLHNTEWHPTSHTGTALGATETKENDLTKIKHEEPTSRTLTTLNIYNHQLGTLSSMHTGAGTAGSSNKERSALLRHDIADLLMSAHKDHANPNDNPTLRYTHLAADTPTTLLTWLKKYTRTTCQHLTSPLFLIPGIFSQTPTLMPSSRTLEQKQKWKMIEQYIHDGTGLEQNWSGVPWRHNGILAITSGTPNSPPESPAHTLATSAIKKAILSAHQGTSTVLLLEAQEKLELSPGARAENRNIQMHKVMTYPQGDLHNGNDELLGPTTNLREPFQPPTKI